MPFTRQLERRYRTRHHIIDKDALIADIHIRLAVSINAVCIVLSNMLAYEYINKRCKNLHQYNTPEYEEHFNAATDP